MKLHVLQQQVEAFADFIRAGKSDHHRFKGDIITHFNTHWTFDTEDFASVYKSSLRSEVTNRLWKRENYRPKEVMSRFIAMEPEYVSQAFRDLFDESKMLEVRLDRFTFYCDELLRMYKRRHREEIVNNHYHDTAIISLYLTGRYPDTYTLYPGRKTFDRALITLGAKGSADRDDYPRFVKVVRIMMKYLADYGLSDRAPNTPQLMLAHEFMDFLAGSAIAQADQ